MKKLVVLFCVSLLMLAVASADGIEIPDGLEVAVVPQKLKIHESPNCDAGVITEVKHDQVLIVLYDEGDGRVIREDTFVKVFEAETGKIGWAEEELLKFYPRHIVIADSEVQIYSSFTKAQKLTEQLEVGSEYLILEETQEYYVIAFHGGAGWVGKSENIYKSEENFYYNMRPRRKEGLVVREAAAYSLPMENAYQVKKFEDGEVISVVSENDNWFIIIIDERYAYIKKEDVEMRR